MKVFLLLALLLSASLASASLEDLAPANLASSAKKLIAKQKIGTGINLLDLDIYDGVSLGIRYRIESEPSYVNSYYTRIDKYEFDQKVSVGDLIEGLDLPMSFDIDKGHEIIFARQFKSQKDSLIALPYSFNNFPLSASRAIERLEVGDFVSFRTSLSLMVGLNSSLPAVTEILQAKAYTHALLSGEFLVHIFRMPDNHVRLKFIAIRNKGVAAGAQVGLTDFSIIGIGLIDKQIRRFADLSADLALKSNVGDLFMLDYVFNLNNDEAAQLFTDIMAKKTRFKEVALANPVASQLGLAQKIMTDATDLEAMYDQDRYLPAANRRVDRIFKGSNSSETKESKFKVGLVIAGFEKGTTYTQNQVVSYDALERPQYYMLDTLSYLKKDKLLFGLFGEQSELKANLLFATDQNFTPTEFVALTLGREAKMKSLSSGDFSQIQEEVRQVLPADLYSQIDWKNWSFSFGAKNNGYFKHEINFHPEAINALPQLHWKKMYQLFVEHLQALGGPKVRAVRGSASDPRAPWQERYHTDIYYISMNLVTAFNSKLNPDQRHQAFVALKQFPVWREYGAKFLISLLPKENLPSLVNYELTVSAKGQETVTYKFGNFDEQSLFRSLMYIQSVITNRSFDLRMIQQ